MSILRRAKGMTSAAWASGLSTYDIDQLRNFFQNATGTGHMTLDQMADLYVLRNPTVDPNTLELIAERTFAAADRNRSGTIDFEEYLRSFILSKSNSTSLYDTPAVQGTGVYQSYPAYSSYSSVPTYSAYPAYSAYPGYADYSGYSTGYQSVSPVVATPTIAAPTYATTAVTPAVVATPVLNANLRFQSPSDLRRTRLALLQPAGYSYPYSSSYPYASTYPYATGTAGTYNASRLRNIF